MAIKVLATFFPNGISPGIKSGLFTQQRKSKAFADQWGYESFETDWKNVIARDDIDAVTFVRQMIRMQKLPLPQQQQVK